MMLPPDAWLTLPEATRQGVISRLTYPRPPEAAERIASTAWLAEVVAADSLVRLLSPAVPSAAMQGHLRLTASRDLISASLVLRAELRDGRAIVAWLTDLLSTRARPSPRPDPKRRWPPHHGRPSRPTTC